MQLARFLNKLFKTGGFVLIDFNLKKYIIGSPEKDNPITIKLLDKKLHYKLLFFPDLYLGEAYADGTLKIENGDLTDFLNLALKNLGINEIIDGYGLMPYTENQIKFIPQLFYKVFTLPFGIQATQIHLNYWSQKEFDNFERFIADNSKKVITYNQALEKINDSFFYTFINLITKKIIQTKRVLRK